MASNTVKMVLSLKDNASKTLRAAGKQAGKTQVSMAGLGKAVGALAIGAAAASAAFIKLGQHVADIVNEVNDFSVVTGLSIETVQALKLSAESTGIELQSMQRGMMKLSDSIQEAKDNAQSAQAEAFDKLGLDPASFKNQDEALFAIVERLRAMEDGIERNAVAMDLFGGGSRGVLQAMQIDFNNARRVVQGAGSDIRNATAEAGEMQAGLALLGTVSDNTKVAFFEAFGGSKGMAGGMALAAGIMAGLKDLLNDIVGLSMKALEGYGLMLSALFNAASGDFETYRSQMRQSRELSAQFREQFRDMVSGGFGIEAGVKAYQDFEEQLITLTDGAGEANGAVGDLGGSTGKAGIEAEQAAQKFADFQASVIGLEVAARQAFATPEGLPEIPGIMTSRALALYGLEEGSEERKTAIAQLVIDDIREAFGTAFSALEGDAALSARGLDLLQQTASVIHMVRLGPRHFSGIGKNTGYEGAIISDLAKIRGELVSTVEVLKGTSEESNQAMRDLFGVDAAEESLQALDKTHAAYQRLAAEIQGINKEEHQALETVQDYERAIQNAEDSANEHFKQLQGASSALMAMIELQTKYTQAGQADEGLSRLIQETLDPATAARFGGDLQAAMAHTIRELQAQINGLEFETMEDLLNVEAFKRDLEDMQFKLQVEADEIKAAQLKIDRLVAAEAAITSVAGVAATLGQGDIFGGVAQAGAATGTPQGAVVSAVFSGLSQFVAMGELAKDSSVKEVSEGIVKTAEEQVEAFEIGMEVFKEVLPDILTLIVTELPFAIIKAVPDIIQGIYVGISQALAEFWNSIKSMFGRTEEEKEAKRQQRQDYWSNWWDGVVGDLEDAGAIRYDSYNSGTGYVSRTGLAMLHQGESVVPVNGRPQQGAMSAGAPVNINISASMIDRDVIPRLVREIEKVTGRFGRMQASFA